MKHFFRPGLISLAICAGAVATAAQAEVAEQCQTVRFSDPGWTDIGVTNAMTTTVLEGLGYETDVSLLAVPIGFQALGSNEIDVFLGNWMPAQQGFFDEYRDGFDQVRANLEGAKFTLAVPQYVQDAGVESFADLAEYGEQFDHYIYGIEPGAPANESIQAMIDSDDFGLDDWELVESSEQAMLNQVGRQVRGEDFVVFLAWEPHPMNLRFDLAYLSGGDDYFGPNYGGATVYTLTRKGYTDECANVGQLLANLEFSLDMESGVMGEVLRGDADAQSAARAYLIENPQVLDAWLDGVETVEGEPGLAAVRSHLGL
ncbi:glycine/betaine ABC transporter substrate-binding protein [Saccharospirillum sp. MSK14-1]|uniref:choline ABC transporter substrate-binding protein n=1 Tax=Saccharospirillum sp. MSK14-1 TaxID=1897632 RepID=UPI000D38E63D|nr:choline ABC transporter substrate-binding protein [Saccharospirillum sp. MSK14-1]PTY38148.1 glycine/betaine ABC transporter substrate-binding protein [Saccharospirillum sp. MSK14-1]